MQFTWDNPRITGSVPVNVRTSTGSVNVNINQSRQLQGNVTLNAETSTGSVTLNMNLQNDGGAKIAATTSLGGINVQQQGFSGNNVPIQSNNYPATSNFDVTLRTTTGSININANSGLVGTRS